ncbi:MAG: hypothetical protein CSA22_04230 [Deltaproteobacteria bacterium]|nr:MAG: hypothetical protein CSA22_04230 [Deltaproteobacteria bacterium]
MIETLILYSGVGAIAGVLAGLLGIGGGLVIVPMLVFCFTRNAIPPELIMHLALGTSLASIMFTSVSSLLAHHRRGAVRWSVVQRITGGILIGTFLGAWVAAQMPTLYLKGFFVVFLLVVGTQMALDKKPKPSRSLPGSAGMLGTGTMIGGVSSLVGIGGGSLSVPFMVWCNIPIHQSIGTASAIGFPIAIAGTAGFILNGWKNPLLPAWSLGYVYLPALAGIVMFSVITAPVGAMLAHRLPVAKLKRIFAGFIFIMAIRMAAGII